MSNMAQETSQTSFSGVLSDTIPSQTPCADISNLGTTGVWGKHLNHKPARKTTSLSSYEKMSSKLALQLTQVTSNTTRTSLKKRKNRFQSFTDTLGDSSVNDISLNNSISSPAFPSPALLPSTPMTPLPNHPPSLGPDSDSGDCPLFPSLVTGKVVTGPAKVPVATAKAERKVDPSWLLRCAGDEEERTSFRGIWDERGGEGSVVGSEKVVLGGVKSDNSLNLECLGDSNKPSIEADKVDIKNTPVSDTTIEPVVIREDIPADIKENAQEEKPDSLKTLFGDFTTMFEPVCELIVQKRIVQNLQDVDFDEDSDEDVEWNAKKKEENYFIPKPKKGTTKRKKRKRQAESDGEILSDCSDDNKSNSDGSDKNTETEMDAKPTNKLVKKKGVKKAAKPQKKRAKKIESSDDENCAIGPVVEGPSEINLFALGFEEDVMVEKQKVRKVHPKSICLLLVLRKM